MESNEKREPQILGLPAILVFSILVWGGGLAGTLIPFLISTHTTTVFCDPYVERFPGEWPAALLLAYACLPVIVGLIAAAFSLVVLINRIRSSKVWIALINFVGSLFLAWLGLSSSFWILYLYFLTPTVQDTLIVDGLISRIPFFAF